MRASIWVVMALLAVPAIAQVRDQPGRRKKAPAAAAQPAAPAPSAPAPAENPSPPGPLKPGDARGTTLLQVWLPGARRVGGFALALEWDATEFVLGAPQTAAALNGYLCQPNTETPGQLRMNCVGLPGEDRGGLLLTAPMSWKTRPPVDADLKVTKREVVDDRGAVLPDAVLELRVLAPGK